MRLSPAAVRRVVAVLVVLHLLGGAALALFGVGLWRTYCEGFGCIGLGIAWMAWAVAYAALLALGLGLWRRPDAGLRRLRNAALVSQLVAGLGLLAYWLVQRAS